MSGFIRGSKKVKDKTPKGISTDRMSTSYDQFRVIVWKR